MVPTISQDIRALVRVGLVTAEPVRVEAASPELEAAMDELARTLATRHAGRTPSEVAGLEPARELYRAFGVDPTKTRPSSEALLRRVLQAKPLPRILNAVDVCNLCSLRFLLPIGLYDAARIRGAVAIRRGGAGEAYAGIRKDAVHLDGRLVLSDEEGPFGNPSSDSLRTSVTPETRSLFMVVFAPASFPRADLERNVAFAQETLARYLAAPGATVDTTGSLIP